MDANTVTAEISGVRHAADLLPIFDCGNLGIGQKRGRIVVGHLSGRIHSVRHPREVIGWRLACRCEQPSKDKPPVKPWIAKQLWARVGDPNEHAPSDYRVFAPDELTVDVIEMPDVSKVAHIVWVQSHIRNWLALSRIFDAITDLKAAHREYHDAVRGAKNTRLVEPLVVATMGLRPDEIEFLNGLLGGGTNG